MDVCEHDSVLPRWLIEAYRATRYRVLAPPSFDLRVNSPSDALARRMRETDATGAVYITAWNPLGVEVDLAQNQRRQDLLLRDLAARGRRWLEAFGAHAEDPSLGEPSVLALGVNRVTACELGRRHEQNAVLWMGEDAVPRLLLLR